MIRVERIPFALPEDERREIALGYEQTVIAILAKAGPSIDDLERLVRLGSNAAALRASVDPRAPEIHQGLLVAGCGAAALFALAASPVGQEVSIRFPDGAERHLMSVGPTDSANSRLWELGFFSAMATRSHEALEVLAHIPMQVLQRSSTKAGQWLYSRLEAFAAFARHEPDALEQELSALKAADPDLVEPAAKDFVLDVASADLALLYQVMTRDQAGFDKALVTALKGHKHYYGRGDRKRDIHGQLALSPLALCVVARDAGMTVNVASDYLPAAFA